MKDDPVRALAGRLAPPSPSVAELPTETCRIPLGLDNPRGWTYADVSTDDLVPSPFVVVTVEDEVKLILPPRGPFLLHDAELRDSCLVLVSAPTGPQREGYRRRGLSLSACFKLPCVLMGVAGQLRSPLPCTLKVSGHEHVSWDHGLFLNKLTFHVVPMGSPEAHTMTAAHIVAMQVPALASCPFEPCCKFDMVVNSMQAMHVHVPLIVYHVATPSPPTQPHSFSTPALLT